MLKTDQTIEDLEKSLEIPSFEVELAMSDLSKKVQTTAPREARYVVCKICGTRVLVGPYDVFKCPNAPHDSEDEHLYEMDTQDVADEVEFDF